MKKTLFTVILTVFAVVFSHAAVVETVETYSPVNKDFKYETY